MRVTLDAKKMPGKWYNIIPDLEFDVSPPMSPSGYPLGFHDLEPLAPHAVIEQEFEKEKREIKIPDELQALYREWRPTPLFRAERLEKRLDTPARIYYKYEGGSPSGSYEFNTAVAQAYYASYEDIKYLVAATGNGEWGASLAAACNFFDIKCKVYMVRASYEERAYGRSIMELLGAEVVPSPSENTRTGSKVLGKDPGSSGSLSIALSEAFEEASKKEGAKFAWGTVMNHIIMHQTLIGQEARLQMKEAGARPDIIISAVGGGSGFGGLVFPFYKEREEGSRFIAVETASAPSLSKGRYAYDYTDSDGFAPLLKMYTIGHGYVPPNIRAGGMRYHGMSPLVSALYREKRIEAKAYTQRRAFEAGVEFARAEGFVPSPESSYAIKAVVDEARACREKKERKNILFLMNTNSNLDIAVFKEFLEGAMEDHVAQDEHVEAAVRDLPEVE